MDEVIKPGKLFASKLSELTQGRAMGEFTLEGSEDASLIPVTVTLDSNNHILRMGGELYRVSPNDPHAVMKDSTRTESVGFFRRAFGKKGKEIVETSVVPDAEIPQLLDRIDKIKPTADEEMRIEQHQKKLQSEAREKEKMLKRIEPILEKMNPEDGIVKNLLIIVDDSISKISHVFKDLQTEEEEEIDQAYKIHEIDFREGEEAIEGYRIFLEMDNNRHLRNITLVLDGNLTQGRNGSEPKIKSGSEVAAKIADICRKMDYPMPYLVGLSSDSEPNQHLAETYPDQYIGNYFGGRSGGWLQKLKERVVMDNTK